MSMKTIAIVLILGVAVAVAVSFRSVNRADAAGGDCYSSAQGPSEPTVCK